MKPEQLLKEGLNQLGFSCSEKHINSFMTFLQELKKWNRAYNLTALKTDEDIIIKHFFDSLLYLKAIAEEIMGNENSRGVSPRLSGRACAELDSAMPDLFSYQPVKLADVGTGAGFPGIPIKIMQPEIDITLIEPTRKKTAFLRHIIRILKLKGINVIDKRIESLGKNHEKTYDVIVSRATFKIKDFLDKACPYVKKRGILLLSKGPKISKEIKELKNQYVIREILRLPLFRIGTTCYKADRNLVILECLPR